MAQIINFDNKCREIDTLRYVEMLRRRSVTRMETSEAKHQRTIQDMQDSYARFIKKMDKALVASIIVAIAAGIYIFLC